MNRIITRCIRITFFSLTFSIIFCSSCSKLSTDEMIAEADTLLLNGDTTGAMENYLEILNSDTTNWKVLNKLGGISIATQNYKSAILYFEKAILANPKLYEARSNLAVSKLRYNLRKYNLMFDSIYNLSDSILRGTNKDLLIKYFTSQSILNDYACILELFNQSSQLSHSALNSEYYEMIQTNIRFAILRPYTNVFNGTYKLNDTIVNLEMQKLLLKSIYYLDESSNLELQTYIRMMDNFIQDPDLIFWHFLCQLKFNLATESLNTLHLLNSYRDKEFNSLFSYGYGKWMEKFNFDKIESPLGGVSESGLLFNSIMYGTIDSCFQDFLISPAAIKFPTFLYDIGRFYFERDPKRAYEVLKLAYSLDRSINYNQEFEIGHCAFLSNYPEDAIFYLTLDKKFVVGSSTHNFDNYLIMLCYAELNDEDSTMYYAQKVTIDSLPSESIDLYVNYYLTHINLKMFSESRKIALFKSIPLIQRINKDNAMELIKSLGSDYKRLNKKLASAN